MAKKTIDPDLLDPWKAERVDNTPVEIAPNEYASPRYLREHETKKKQRATLANEPRKPSGKTTKRTKREKQMTKRRTTRTPAAVPNGSGVTSDLSRADVRNGMAAALLMRAGLVHDDERAADLGRRFQRYSATSLADISCERAGIVPPDEDGALFRAATTHGDLGNVFSSVVNKVLMQSFEEASDTTEGWVNVVDVRDFKENTRVQVGKLGGLGKIARGGTAPHAEPSDVAEAYKVARYGSQIIVDEQDLIDDDLHAMMQLPKEMGAAAARLRPDLVYSILLANANLSDSVALFDASTHGNLATGAGSALDATSLQAGLAAMAKQTQNGVLLNIRGQHLIVPADLRFTALQLVHSAEVRTTASGEHGTSNPIQGEGLTIHSDPRIGAAGVTDPSTGTGHTGSAVNWFLTADERQAATIEVGYREGTNRRPIIRPFVLSQGQWGVGWDISMDIGAKALAYQSMYRAVGA